MTTEGAALRQRQAERAAALTESTAQLPAGHRSVAQTYDRHGKALYALAYALTDAADPASAVVVQAIADACHNPGFGALVSERRRRRALARLVYLRCVGLGYAPTSPRRVSLALCLFGAHTYRDVAALLDLPASRVASMLRTGLSELETSAAGRPAS